MFAYMQHLPVEAVAIVIVSAKDELPPALQRVSDELVSLGPAGFTKRYPRQTADDLLLRLGQTAVWSTSVAAAVLASTGARSTVPSSRPDTNRVFNEHGIDPLKLAHPKLPVVGDQFLRRGDIQRIYGGNGVAGIACLRDDDVVNCFSDDESGSYADDPPTPLESFGYRGEGREGDQEIARRGNRLLERARTNGSAVRFWHRPKGGSFTFLFWCAVVGRYWGRGLDADKQSRKEIVWILHKVSDPLNVVVPSRVREIGEAETANMDAGPGPEVKEHPSYVELRDRAVSRSPGETHRETIRWAPIRSRYARQAVLVRAEDQCEAPWCTGMPKDRLETGAAILEVDHVNDLAFGGADDPSNMVALCPNCHATKTRGKNIAKRRRQLSEVAREKDKARVAAESSAE